MDPMNREPEEYGYDHEGDDARDTRGGLLPERGPSAPARVRTARVVSGDLLLTVNPVDGSEIETCPPGEQPAPPRRRTAQERVDAARAVAPPVPPGPAAPRLPLLERQEEHERLVQLLARGRSVRLTGPAGSGRTVLLDAVAADCAGLAPDGVVRLSGHHRTPTELLYELFAIVQHAPDHRPDRPVLLERVHDIGAVVVVDDLEFGGTTLDELLTAAPECAFLLAATPDIPAPSPDAHVEEVSLTGLGRATALELLESAVDRPLTDDEANWAGDLWFESEGLPLRFVQAGALLRQRDRLRVTPAEFDAFGAQEDAPSEFDAFGALDDAFGPADAAPADATDIELRDIPLPSLGEGAAPAALLASRLSRSAQETLRFTVALGGEVPHQAHLPALVGDTHADAALGELMTCGLLTPVGSRYRLAAGVLTQLRAQGYGGTEEETAARAHTVAQHYAWWAGHPSVTPARAVAESDALLAALTALRPGTTPEHPATAALLARSAAPAFAAGLHWGAWERVLRSGLEAARIAGEVAEEAYFHHELGVLALCSGNLERARAELEASIGMRGVLADKRGTVAGRRALALVADRAGGPLGGDRTPAGDELPAARYEESASPPRGIPKPVVPRAVAPKTAPIPAFPDFADEGPTLITRSDAPPSGGGTKAGGRFGIIAGARRNLVAVGTGALLAAVLGTVVTIGATSGTAEDPGSNRVTSDRTASEDGGDDGLEADEPTDDATGAPSDAPSSPGPSGSATTPGTPGTSGTPSSPGGSTPTTGTTTGAPMPTTTPPRPTTTPTRTTKPSSTPSQTPSSTPSQTPSTTPSTTPSSTATSDNPSNSASATLSSGPASGSTSPTGTPA
ncbi:ATP-binding protein [Streptomyces sp. NBC_01353]|uniref:ATP-binding protein n=1 Tax=Streptomyces sp. NBC_01353 TaxID=2903835 RepID=UPI002E37419C|nr:ATP-binding protein [Streptomyces sp. NBC_01353]